MTSPSIIGDDEAKRIALGVNARDDSSYGRLAATGEISREFAEHAERLSRTENRPRYELLKLLIYVAHHGERGPQPNWNAEHGVGGGARG